ncbi:MAG TPA: hypothetical protein VLL75_11100, partial [Vicinamibacteria bacterium]|nr:hypothetical protein [Vicinamibacteria bacterium]
VFERTWGRRATPFWPKATQRVRERVPGFCFMAEVYWDLEWTLLQQGFDYAYDKRLYDRLCEGHAQPVRGHLQAGLDYQSKLARFLENHDEPRAAATFAPQAHRAAAVLTFLSWRLQDQVGSAPYERDGDDLHARAVPGRAGVAGLRLLPGAHAVINRPLFR